ncbi:MAG: TonB-dependent receptor plug domain-containing protein [Paludibacteraceae bacterium]|nr:TonB-dependent receptor plug domain-containing protein [Paludibacteraceae bacterium]
MNFFSRKSKVESRKIFLSLGAIALSMSAAAQTSEEQASDTVGVNDFRLEEIVVSAPVMQSTVSKQEIKHAELNRDNTGQNLPYLLSVTPSLVTTSDDGLGIGYTYFHIRGTDQTRINMTINEVPLNDAESQGVFWVNLTDMASGVSNLQVQRGIGTSANGGSSFGASVNLRTLDATVPQSSHPGPVRAELDFNGGMYNTFREMVKADVYLGDRLDKKGAWHIGGRFSKVNSDGYIERAKSDLLSYQGEIGWQNMKSAVTLTAFGGKERTYMAWYGVDYNTAWGINGANRRYNPAGEYVDKDGNTAYYDNQTDNYQQHHVHLHIGHRFNIHWTLSATAHYTFGTGYYEMLMADWNTYKADNITRKGLRNHFYGGILSSKYVHEKVDVQMGLALNQYRGLQYGTIDTTCTGDRFMPYYEGFGLKTDGNIYAKANWRVLHRGREKLSLYGDVQYRIVDYKIWGDNEEKSVLFSPEAINKHHTWHFFNPKAGLTYDNGGHRLSATFAMAHREPTRNNFVLATGPEDPKPERLYDYELGYSYSSAGILKSGYAMPWTIGLNLYMMDYDNQLIATGSVSSVGYINTINVKDSYRTGAEFQFGVEWTKWFSWKGNVTWSRNKWKDAAQWRTISFSPDWTAGNIFSFHAAGFNADIQTLVVSSQYLSNDEDPNATLKAYTVTNLMMTYALPFHTLRNARNIPDITLKCQLNNLFDTKYVNNGGTDGTYVWYFPQAGINVHAGFVVQW